MLRKLYLFLMLWLTLGASCAFAQTKIDPWTRINWVATTGAGYPAATCPSATVTIGATYWDTTNHVQYGCDAAGWHLSSATGGGTSVTYSQGTPTGTVNGTNRVFTVGVNCVAGTTQVWDNYLLVPTVGYTFSGTTITYTIAPSTSDYVFYQCVVTSSGLNFYQGVPTGTVNGSNTSFTLAHAPVSNSLVVWDNYPLVYGIGYTLSGTTITFTVAPATGDTVYTQMNY